MNIVDEPREFFAACKVPYAAAILSVGSRVGWRLLRGGRPAVPRPSAYGPF